MHLHYNTVRLPWGNYRTSADNKRALILILDFISVDFSIAIV